MGIDTLFVPLVTIVLDPKPKPPTMNRPPDGPSAQFVKEFNLSYHNKGL